MMKPVVLLHFLKTRGVAPNAAARVHPIEEDEEDERQQKPADENNTEGVQS